MTIGKEKAMVRQIARFDRAISKLQEQRKGFSLLPHLAEAAALYDKASVSDDHEGCDLLEAADEAYDDFDSAVESLEMALDESACVLRVAAKIPATLERLRKRPKPRTIDGFVLQALSGKHDGQYFTGRAEGSGWDGSLRNVKVYSTFAQARTAASAFSFDVTVTRIRGEKV